MNFEECAAKPLLKEEGIAIPRGKMATTIEHVSKVAAELGPCVVKAQVPSGKRGKAGGIKLAKTPQEAEAAASDILGMQISGYKVEKLLIEEQKDIEREFYLAIINDTETRSPSLLFSTLGGMDIEAAAMQDPKQVHRMPINISTGLDTSGIINILQRSNLGDEKADIADISLKLYSLYRRYDAELLEINPLVLTKSNEIIALDCKFSMDDSAIQRHPELAVNGCLEKVTKIEAEAKTQGLKYIELDGSVGVLANGAGLTMTTMDVVKFYGGKPANFMEIGGEAYTKGKPALELVLANTKVKSLVINFCGAFARCDVMAEGIITAWEEIHPTLPVFFSVHGTGDEEARKMLKQRLGISPYDTMDQACEAAVKAAQKAEEGGKIDSS